MYAHEYITLNAMTKYNLMRTCR